MKERIEKDPISEDLNEIELHGLVFTKISDQPVWKILDLSYGRVIGHLGLREGPGYILDMNANGSWLDFGQMSTIVEFIKNLPSLRNK